MKNENEILKTSTRCIQNLSDCGFTKTGMNPAEFATYEAEQEAKIKHLHGLVDAIDNPPEPLTESEIDLIIQGGLS